MLALSSSSFSLRSPPSANPRFRKVQSSSSSASPEEETELRSELPAANFPAIKSAKRVVLVRHGQSTWNAEGRIQGSSNFSVLTSKGETQAETSRQMLLHDSFDVCFTSPLNRSKRTAEIIWDRRKEPIIPEFDLREIDLYSFQGLLKREGKEKFGSAFLQWQLDAPNFLIDGHYPVRELWDRSRNCWDKILTHESKSVLVVAHNAVNQALIATAIGLGTEYFRILLQSNCGVSVLDFIPRPEIGFPLICLNRLNQEYDRTKDQGKKEEYTKMYDSVKTLVLLSKHRVKLVQPSVSKSYKISYIGTHGYGLESTPSSPLDAGSTGRKTSHRIVLVCYGSLQSTEETNFSNLEDWPMNMLGIIQSQKTAELLLDLKVDTVVRSPRKASVEAAKIISQVQEAADCLGADSVPRYVDVKEIEELDVDNMLGRSKEASVDDKVLMAVWNQAQKIWKTLLDELSNPSDQQKTIVVIAHPILHIALVTHCLNLTQDWMGSFHLDEGSASVIDFPDGPTGKGTIRCINYTSHLGKWAIPITKPTNMG